MLPLLQIFLSLYACPFPVPTNPSLLTVLPPASPSVYSLVPATLNRRICICSLVCLADRSSSVLWPLGITGSFCSRP